MISAPDPGAPRARAAYSDAHDGNPIIRTLRAQNHPSENKACDSLGRLRSIQWAALERGSVYAPSASGNHSEHEGAGGGSLVRFQQGANSTPFRHERLVVLKGRGQKKTY